MKKASKLQRSIWSRKRKTKEWMRDLLQGVWSIVGPCFGSPQICCASNRVSSWYRTLSIEAHRPNCYSKPMKGTKLIPNTSDVRRILHVGSLMPIFTRQYCQPLDEFPERLWMLRWQRYAFWKCPDEVWCTVLHFTYFVWDRRHKSQISAVSSTQVCFILQTSRQTRTRNVIDTKLCINKQRARTQGVVASLALWLTTSRVALFASLNNGLGLCIHAILAEVTSTVVSAY